VGQKLCIVRHAYTHFRITVHAFECEYHSTREPQTLGVQDWRWVTLVELDDYAFPVVDRKIMAVVRDSWRQASFLGHTRMERGES
jgi:A/G-specific adenine glycosylase